MSGSESWSTQNLIGSKNSKKQKAPIDKEKSEENSESLISKLQEWWTSLFGS